MTLLGRLEDAWKRLRLWNLRRAGLTIADDCRIDGMPTFGSEPYLITIGKHVAISGEVAFITHDAGIRLFRDDPRYRHVVKYGRITIQDNCLIGFRVTILPGVVIGPNSIVAAGSVVTRNVPPGVVASGFPAVPVMSVEHYAEWALATTPPYDLEEYRRDKRAALLKMRLRGSAPTPPPVPTPPAAGSGAAAPAEGRGAPPPATGGEAAAPAAAAPDPG